MSSQDTRNKLIDIIKRHQLENGLTKLQISKLAELAGITRQAFNRYYGDLKIYATGEESIGKLLIDDKASLSQLLESKEQRVSQLEQALIEAHESHKDELNKAIRNHTTSLMKNDLMIYESAQLQSTLAAQRDHTASLIERINELQITNTKLVAESISATTARDTSRSYKTVKNFISVALDMKKAIKQYSASCDFDAYEDSKDSEINKSIELIQPILHRNKAEVILFQERYISDFNKFAIRFTLNTI